ncbi:MAG: hypothetical protein OEW87_10345, partial [Flavobacteriaceae bacterium]|nr:hypothetical protein [Flavobacteriaceae bacterium]
RQALIVEMGDAREYGDAEKFIAKIGNTQLDLSNLKSKRQLRYVSTRGIPFDLRFNDKQWYPIAKVKGVSLDFNRWPVCESPYVSSRDGVLSVNDGLKGFKVDWSGDTPKYTNYAVKQGAR